MTKLPRPTGREMVRFLERQGFSVIRVRGSHHFMERREQRTTVPVHGNRTLKIGTLRSILRDIGLSPTEFEQQWSAYPPSEYAFLPVVARFRAGVGSRCTTACRAAARMWLAEDYLEPDTGQRVEIEQPGERRFGTIGCWGQVHLPRPVSISRNGQHIFNQEQTAHTLMTKQQQTTVLLSQAQRKVVTDLLPNLADRLKLAEKNLRTISFTPNELATIRDKAKTAYPHAENGMKRNSLRHVVDAVTKAIEDSEGIGSIPASERLYQFKITLIDSDPPIWRRIQVRDCTLDKFHERLQTAMGWTNSHLHEFKINGDRYGDPELLDDGFEDDYDYIDSTQIKISEIVPKTGKRFRFRYRYDFGDCWDHEVLFEGCLAAEKGQRYPICVEGERACPPEDVGGIRGYFEFLEALASPESERHDEFVRWAGRFDPEKFDAGKRTKVMWRGLPDWRKM